MVTDSGVTPKPPPNDPAVSTLCPSSDVGLVTCYMLNAFPIAAVATSSRASSPPWGLPHAAHGMPQDHVLLDLRHPGLS